MKKLNGNGIRRRFSHTDSLARSLSPSHSHTHTLNRIHTWCCFCYCNSSTFSHSCHIYNYVICIFLISIRRSQWTAKSHNFKKYGLLENSSVRDYVRSLTLLFSWYDIIGMWVLTRKKSHLDVSHRNDWTHAAETHTEVNRSHLCIQSFEPLCLWPTDERNKEWKKKKYQKYINNIRIRS